MIPKKMTLANLPTPVQTLDKLTAKLQKKNPNSPAIHIKRDDFSGMEVSGNKIRKLEYALQEAVEKGADLIITCGGIQSNHCRATAAIGRKLGLKVVLLLRGEEGIRPVGNHFMDFLFGATIHMIHPDAIEGRMEDLFPKYVDQYREAGYQPYCVPIGASNGIGAFGYYHCMKEIMTVNDGHQYDAIVVTIGSAGTYAGLLMGKKDHGFNGDVYGINIAADRDYFYNRTLEIIEEAHVYQKDKTLVPKEWIHIIDGYQGQGYALNTGKDFEFIKEMGQLEGLLVDPVYTGKALNGLVEECLAGRMDAYENILFIHTGGLYGLLAKAGEMVDYI